MSCIENHYIAIVHAKKSLEYARISIKTLIKASTKVITHAISAQKLRKKIYIGEPLKKNFREKLNSNIGILSLCLKMLGKQDSSGLIKLNTIENLKPEIKESFDLHSAMKLKPLTYFKLKTLTNLDFELENEEVFKKLYNVAIALYLISTEAAMLDDKEQAIITRNKAVSIVRSFMPNDCLLVSQIQYLDE